MEKKDKNGSVVAIRVGLSSSLYRENETVRKRGGIVTGQVNSLKSNPPESNLKTKVVEWNLVRTKKISESAKDKLNRKLLGRVMVKEWIEFEKPGPGAAST